MPIAEIQRAEHARWLLELTAIPTAAGKEHRVIEWIEHWVEARADLALFRDAAGNLLISITRRAAGSATSKSPSRPTLFTAHLDHPAFVVDRVIGPATIGASFRGGVMAPYFNGARVAAHTASGILRGEIVESEPGEPFRRAVIELDDDSGADAVEVGDIVTWNFPEPKIKDGVLHTHACDDLAAVAAALAALDLLRTDEKAGDVRVLLTRAEEVGFVGAIAACMHNTIPPGSRVIALENSRSFAESPIGAGPIVRVGDRLTTFSPDLTRSIALLAEKLAGQDERKVGDAAPPRAPSQPPTFKWQRKLMPGGACEASAYCAWGHDATCLCLPLGNYHNMGDLDRVQEAVSRGDKDIHAPIEPEYISIDDYHNLVALLVECGRALTDVEPIMTRLKKMHAERAFVLDR